MNDSIYIQVEEVTLLQESEEQRKQRRRQRKAFKAAAGARREKLQQRKLGEWALPSQTGVDTCTDAPDLGICMCMY